MKKSDLSRLTSTEIGNILIFFPPSISLASKAPSGPVLRTAPKLHLHPFYEKFYNFQDK